MTILFVVVFIAIVFFLISVYALRTTILMDPSYTKIHTEEFLNANGIKGRDALGKWNVSIEKINLESRWDYSIPVEYICSNNSYDNATVVLVHGHELTSASMYPIAKVLLDNNINVVLYDQRSHGDNAAKTVSFGYYESSDLGQVIELIEGKMKEKKMIGALGQSMGAATVGFYSGTKHGVEHLNFAILDCPYNSMLEVLRTAGIRRNCKNLDFILGVSNIANKIYLGFTYNDMNVSNSIRNNRIPTLVYSTEADVTCPCYMAKEVYNNILHDNKKMVKFRECGHIRGFYDENETYVNELLNFIFDCTNKKGGNSV